MKNAFLTKPKFRVVPLQVLDHTQLADLLLDKYVWKKNKCEPELLLLTKISKTIFLR